jgi:hypothetical protein
LEVSEAPLVTGKMVCVCLTAKADFLISYEDGRREIVELKGYVLKRGGWRASAEHARKYRLTVLIMSVEQHLQARSASRIISAPRLEQTPAGISLQV